jgi:hypothetical protein
MATSTINSNFSINTSSLNKLVRDLEESELGIVKETNVALREGAEIVAVKARGLASWSSRIPGSVRVGGAGARTVVKAGNTNAPHAAAYEHHGNPGTFRHPVYGNRSVWVSQAARPFLAPALASSEPQVVQTVVKKLDTMFASHGL